MVLFPKKPKYLKPFLGKFKNKNVVGAGFVINLPELGGLKKLEDLGIQSKYLFEF